MSSWWICLSSKVILGSQRGRSPWFLDNHENAFYLLLFDVVGSICSNMKSFFEMRKGPWDFICDNDWGMYELLKNASNVEPFFGWPRVLRSSSSRCDDPWDEWSFLMIDVLDDILVLRPLSVLLWASLPWLVTLALIPCWEILGN